MPFMANSSAELFRKIKNCEWEFQPKAFDKVSDECKDLIRKLIVADPKKRLTSKQALDHPWFRMFKEMSQDISFAPLVDDEVIARLRKFKGQSHLKRAAMNMLV